MDNADIVFYIFQYLGITEILKCSTINVLMKRICDMQYKRLLIYDYGIFFVKIFNDVSFKQAYIKCYNLDIIRKLYVLDSSLINFFKLPKMNLISCRIKEIPESIIQLINLQKLCLSNNQITELPESIGVETSATALVRLFTCL